MSNPANLRREDGSSVTWRLVQQEYEVVVGSSGLIVFELADIHGSTLATISMPSETINALLRPHHSIFAELQLDGSVSLESELFASAPPPQTTDVLELVRQALAAEMLEDEPDALQMLAKFRNRLLKSLEHVEQAIASLSKD